MQKTRIIALKQSCKELRVAAVGREMTVTFVASPTAT